MIDDDTLRRRARKLAATIEPFTGQVYFSPECHAEYVALGFAPSPKTLSSGVQLPDGPAYFTSRGSAMGQVSGEVVASAFAVFNPAAVVPSVTFGWTLTDASTIASARTRGATAQLVRILGERPDGVERAIELLHAATDPLRPEGRPLFAGVLSLGLPGDPVADAWRLADRLREFRGDAHTAAWTSAGFDAAEIGLVSEQYWGLAARTYVRTRAWSDDDLDAATERLRDRGLLDGDDLGLARVGSPVRCGKPMSCLLRKLRSHDKATVMIGRLAYRLASLSAAGREAREQVEVATDRQMRPAIEALGDGFDDLVEIVAPWTTAIRAAAGYLPSGPHDLAAKASRTDR